ncbi:MAG: hypothetical protein HQL50_14910, partial [Magnetococcales bacterium]|nr:hypothetical protein [Magnetococcales bacterium]
LPDLADVSIIKVFKNKQLAKVEDCVGLMALLSRHETLNDEARHILHFIFGQCLFKKEDRPITGEGFDTLLRMTRR